MTRGAYMKNLRSPARSVSVEEADVDVRIIVNLLKLVARVVGNKGENQLSSAESYDEDQSRWIRLSIFVDIRAEGIMAREWRWPSADLVVSIPVFTDWTISCSPS